MFETGSELGIDGGRVSKLEIKDGPRVVASYDRGWDVEPDGAVDRLVLKAVLDLLDMLP